MAAHRGVAKDFCSGQGEYVEGFVAHMKLACLRVVDYFDSLEVADNVVGLPEGTEVFAFFVEFLDQALDAGAGGAGEFGSEDGGGVVGVGLPVLVEETGGWVAEDVGGQVGGAFCGENLLVEGPAEGVGGQDVEGPGDKDRRDRGEGLEEVGEGGGNFPVFFLGTWGQVLETAASGQVEEVVAFKGVELEGSCNGGEDFV